MPTTSKPVLLIVDDNPDVRSAAEDDLRNRYGERYDVVSASSAADALEVLGKLRERATPVALILADDRMPRVRGTDLLERSRELAPDARRVLMALYEDTADALQAINRGSAHDYIVKPWERVDERVYPLLDDLLEDWRASARPVFAGVRVVGTRWSPQTHQLRDFLGRNQVPYRWLDLESDDVARRLVERVAPESPHLPMVLFPNGSYLAQPSTAELAEKIGLQTHAEQPFYDLLVVGGGPAGLAAAVYGASEGLRTALIEREAPGGQAGTSSRIENYLGFPAGLSGGDLTRRAVAQARRFGAEILSPQEVDGVAVNDRYRVLQLADGTQLTGQALLIAAGVAYRQLQIPGAERLSGAGLYYGSAMTEALACRGSDVYIVGGANSAGQAAVYLSRYARNVTLLVRGQSLSASMSKYLIDQIADAPSIHVRPCTQVTELHGALRLEQISVVDVDTGKAEKLTTPALFVFIGAQPNTDWLDGVVERDQYGFILTGPDLKREDRGVTRWDEEREPYLLETSTPGIFAAGDVRHGSVKRVASGVGEGAMAVSFIHQYLALV
jgi:thioredoxin reductase (NADPH)